MPEVAGDAGLLVNPQSDDDIAAAMERIATDDELRAQLIANAKIQRTKFSWDKSAIDLWNGIEKMLGK